MDWSDPHMILFPPPALCFAEAARLCERVVQFANSGHGVTSILLTAQRFANRMVLSLPTIPAPPNCRAVNDERCADADCLACAEWDAHDVDSVLAGMRRFDSRAWSADLLLEEEVS
jgi:hypothetical protein